MTNPFDIQNAGFQRRDQILRQADTWRLLRPVRKERAQHRRRAFALVIARLFRPWRGAPQPTRRPAATGE